MRNFPSRSFLLTRNFAVRNSFGAFAGRLQCSVLRNLTQSLVGGQRLAREQVSVAVEALTNEKVAVDDKAAFLTALSRKGETAEEITWFAEELRHRCVPAMVGEEMASREVLDVVGTGGDRLSTFNISTTVALLCAAAGVLVAKHGNRASTSPIGSADVMEALKLEFDLGPLDAMERLRRHGFTYLFAPKYHPCFKHIIPARKLCAASGQATIFNFLGPLLNPARPSAMLLGVARPELCEPLAKVLQSLGVRRAMVVSGSVPSPEGPRFLDEISPLGTTTVSEFYQERGLNTSELDPRNFPLQPVTLADLKGGDRVMNANTIRAILNGEERGPKRDAVLLNAAAALFVAGRAPNLAEGWDLAAQTIDSGKAGAKLKELVAARVQGH